MRLHFLTVAALFLMLVAPTSVLAFELTSSPGTATILQGGATSVSINISGKTIKPIVIAVTEGLPTGVTVKFTPASCVAPCNVIMLVASTEQTAPGTYGIPVIGAAEGTSANTNFSVTIQAIPSFNFSLGLTSLSGTVSSGESIGTTLNLAQVSGTSESVILNATGQPSGVTVKFSIGSCKPSCSALATIVSSSMTSGTYPITITATAGSITKSAVYALTVTPVALASFALTVLPTGSAIFQKDVANAVVTLSQLSGTSQNVSLVVGSKPNGTGITMTPTSCKPPCSATMAISTSENILPGTYPISIIGSSGGIVKFIEYQLTINKKPSATPVDVRPAVAPVSVQSAVVTTQHVAPTGRTSSTGYLTMRIARGSRGSEVLKLQEFLASVKSLRFSESSITGFYGPITEKAVGAFQIKYAIVSSSSAEGYGVVGPKTRAKMNADMAL